MNESNKKFFRITSPQMEDKRYWLKNRLLINLGFVPKLFGYTDRHLYLLTNGKLKEYTSGVEYYFGITLKGTETKPEQFPRALTENGVIRAIHAPFSKDSYPYPFLRRIKKIGIKTLYQYIRYRIIARADGNAWHRLPKAIEIASSIGAEKITIHAIDIILAPHARRLFRELNTLGKKRRLMISLENVPRYPSDQKSDKSEWRIAHHPVELIEYLKKNRLDAMKLTVDTAHLAASGYDVHEMWKKIKQFTGHDINSAISHFHLADYDAENDFDAARLGDGVIGLETFRALINDLYHLHYNGTISIEVAPLYFQKKIKLISHALKRVIMPSKVDLLEEEEYLLGMIQELLD